MADHKIRQKPQKISTEWNCETKKQKHKNEQNKSKALGYNAPRCRMLLGNLLLQRIVSQSRYVHLCPVRLSSGGQIAIILSFSFHFFYSFFAAARGKNKIALQKPHTYTYACCISGWSSLSTTLQINWHRRYHCIFTRTICLRRKIFEFNQKCRLASERRSSISTRFILIDLFRWKEKK